MMTQETLRSRPGMRRVEVRSAPVFRGPRAAPIGSLTQSLSKADDTGWRIPQTVLRKQVRRFLYDQFRHEFLP